MNSFLSFFFSFFLYNDKVIEYFLPFSTGMKSYKKRKSPIYLLFLITLKVSVAALAWYLVAIPFLEAFYHGYRSLYFQTIGIAIGIITVLILFFTFVGLINKKFMRKDRSVSVTSLFLNNSIKSGLKVIYWQFLITTFIMLMMEDMEELSPIVLESLEKHSFLNIFTLFAISIIYAFTNKYVEIKIHNYFYYFFDLYVDLEEYERRVNELSRDYSILYNKFKSNMFRSDRNLARDSRVIVLRNKYVPISFTLTYNATNFERHYSAIYQDDYIAGIRPSYEKNMRESNVLPRTQIIQKYYPEKLKNRLKAGRREISIPIGKVLIIARVISVFIAIALPFVLDSIFTWEDFLRQKDSVLLSFAFLLGILLITYLFTWFYTNIAISIGMFFLIKEVDFTEEPTFFFIVIAATIVFNLMAISFWKEKKIKDLLYLR